MVELPVQQAQAKSVCSAVEFTYDTSKDYLKIIKGACVEKDCYCPSKDTALSYAAMIAKSYLK